MFSSNVMGSVVLVPPQRSLQQESERIQATAQSREEMLRQLRDLVDYEIREAADLQVRKCVGYSCLRRKLRLRAQQRFHCLYSVLYFGLNTMIKHRSRTETDRRLQI